VIGTVLANPFVIAASVLLGALTVAWAFRHHRDKTPLPASFRVAGERP
jgi:hypothetical protein